MRRNTLISTTEKSGVSLRTASYISLWAVSVTMLMVAVGL